MDYFQKYKKYKYKYKHLKAGSSGMRLAKEKYYPSNNPDKDTFYPDCNGARMKVLANDYASRDIKDKCSNYNQWKLPIYDSQTEKFKYKDEKDPFHIIQIGSTIIINGNQYKVDGRLGKTGASGSTYLVTCTRTTSAKKVKVNHQYAMKQIIPVYLDGQWLEGTCMARFPMNGPHTWKPGARSWYDHDQETQIRERWNQLSDAAESQFILPRNICDDLFMNEIRNQQVAAEHGISPNIIDYDSKLYCIVMEKMDKTLTEQLKQQNGHYSKQQIDRILDIINQMNHLNINQNDFAMHLGNWMVKGDKIYLIDFGAAQDGQMVKNIPKDYNQLKEQLSDNSLNYWCKSTLTTLQIITPSGEINVI